MTKEEANIIDELYNTHQISNDAYKQIMSIAQHEKKVDDILDNIKAKIMQLDYDIEDVDYDYNDMAQTDVMHMICREEVLRIINQHENKK